MIEFWKGETCRIWRAGSELRFEILAERRDNVVFITEGKLVPQPGGALHIVPAVLRSMSRETGEWRNVPNRGLEDIGERGLWALRSRHHLEGWIIARTRLLIEEHPPGSPVPDHHWFPAMLPEPEPAPEPQRYEWRCLGDVLKYSATRGESLAGLARIAGVSRRLLQRAVAETGSHHRGYLLDPRWPVGLGCTPLRKLADWASRLGDPTLTAAFRQLGDLSASISATRGGRRGLAKVPKG